MLQGAGLRLTMRGADGELLGGRYEFYDDSGSRVSVSLVVRDRWQPGSDRWATLSRIDPYGTCQSSGPFQPGRYRLALIAPGHTNRSVTVELRAGEYGDVDVTLSK